MTRVTIRRTRRGSAAARPVGALAAPRSLTAAVQPVTSAPGLKKSLGASAPWHEAAWKYVELVGELAYYVGWRANSASRCTILASEVDERGKPTGGISDDAPAAEAEFVRDLVNSVGGGSMPGQVKLMTRIAMILSVPGETWVAMVVRDPSREKSGRGSDPVDLSTVEAGAEEWYAFDRTEIAVSNRDIVVTLPDGVKHTINTAVDCLFRVWDEHPRDAKQTTSPIWANRATLNEIVRATATIDNATKSRLIGNGMVMVPSELSLPRVGAPTAYPLDDAEDAPDNEPLITQGSAAALQDLIATVASVAHEDPDSMAAVLPIIVGAPGDQLKNVKWIRPAADIPKEADEIRNSSIQRLAHGLDVEPERILGMGDANHWSAWALDESDIKVHIAPLVELICYAFTKALLRPALIDAGIDPDKYVFWYDSTALTQDPDKGDEAVTAHERGAATSASLRRYLGIDEDAGYDLTTREGWIEFCCDKIALDPALNMPVLMPVLAQLVPALGLPEVAVAPSPAIESPAADEPPASSEPGTEDDPEEISASVRAVTRLCVNRALELAGKRMRTRELVQGGALAGATVHELHTRVGPVDIDRVPALIEGWTTGLEPGDLADLGMDPVAFCRMVETTATAALTTARPWRFQIETMRGCLTRGVAGVPG